MYELKTKENAASVDEFLNSVEPEARRKDCLTLYDLMRELTGEHGAMWGGSIVGFGKYRYTYASGHSGESFMAGFSPRKQNLTLYIMAGFEDYDQLLTRLGKYKTGKSCLYLKSLDDVDMDALRELVAESVKAMRLSYPQ